MISKPPEPPPQKISTAKLSAQKISEKPEKCKCCGNKQLATIGVKNEYTFWECPECAFIFTELDQQQIKEAYESGYHNVDEGAPKTGWAKSLEFLSPALAWMPDKAMNILDFGCGESKIPQRLRSEGHRVIAVDLVPPLEPHPDRLTGDILNLELESNSFDLIYSYQVFEHLSNPYQILERLFRLLKKDAKLLIHTDMETPERKSGENFVEWWYVLPPDHCSYYRFKTFEKMVENLGHSIIYKNPKVILSKKH